MLTFYKFLVYKYRLEISRDYLMHTMSPSFERVILSRLWRQRSASYYASRAGEMRSVHSTRYAMIQRHNKAIHCRLCIRFKDNPVEKSYDLITPTQETLSAHDLLAVDVVKIHLTNTILRHNFDVNLGAKSY